MDYSIMKESFRDVGSESLCWGEMIFHEWVGPSGLSSSLRNYSQASACNSGLGWFGAARRAQEITVGKFSGLAESLRGFASVFILQAKPVWKPALRMFNP
jgi:hypothetical protein